MIEAPTKRLEFGAGYSTDTQYRVSASYSDVDIDDTALQMYASARIESKMQQADVRFVRPPTPSGWIDTYATGVQRTDIENLVTRTAAVTARRRAIDERRTPAFGIGFYVNDQTPAGRADRVVARAVRRRRVHVAQRRQPARPDARAGWPTCSSAWAFRACRPSSSGA